MADKSIDALLMTPEAQKAISEAAAKAVADLMKGNASVLPGDSQTQRLFSEMALAIAEMNNQVSGRPKPLAPEIMAKRQAAAKKLDELLGEVARNLRKARETGDQQMIEQWLPKYRVTGKVYFKEQMIEPFSKPARRGDSPSPTVITWSGPPNHSLHPKNGIARKLVDLFRESVGSPAILKSISGPNGGQAAQDNRQYWMTVQGNIVKGDAPPKAMVLNVDDDDDDFAPSSRDSIDPTAPEVHVLGTVALPAKQGNQLYPNKTAEQLERMQTPVTR